MPSLLLFMLINPRIHKDRLKHDCEEFVGIYFESGEARDTARKLWDFIESLNTDLSGLHPDDDLFDILELDSDDRDSLDVEIIRTRYNKALHKERAKSSAPCELGRYIPLRDDQYLIFKLLM